jgi:soluble lytic murein transglycosylase-like protein
VGALKLWGISISFWLMACSISLQGEGLHLEERVRAVSTYYAQHYARLYGVPLELVEAIIEAESDWQPEAVSSKGAVGLMQLMPATAQRFQVRNRCNIEENIRGGVSYVALLHNLFKGDLRLVTAAYMAGEKRIMQRGLAYSNPQVFCYVSQVVRLYRQKRQTNRTTK